MFGRRNRGIVGEANAIDSIIPGSKSTYYLLRIGGFLALITFSSLGGWAFLESRSESKERRNVLAEAGPVLVLGGDGVELLKKMGGADCTAAEGSVERWIFRVRYLGDGPESGACQPMSGDLVVRVEGRRIVSFVPIHGESQAVSDATSFAQYQRRYSGGPPRRGAKR